MADSPKPARAATPLCPHCKGPLGGHVCPDRDAWTPQERDEWRRLCRKLSPAVRFAPSTAQLADRMGALNRGGRHG